MVDIEFVQVDALAFHKIPNHGLLALLLDFLHECALVVQDGFFHLALEFVEVAHVAEGRADARVVASWVALDCL